MILNASRIPVWKWNSTDASLCPDCNSPLLARKGEFVVWHWAHYPGSYLKSDCTHSESEWHLLMKFAYLQFANWQIEFPLVVGSKKFRVDAINQKTGNIREFIHSLSPTYPEKHNLLKAQKYFNVLWIMDGEKFVSIKKNPTRDNKGIKEFLKINPYTAHEVLGCLVHYKDQIFKEWKENIWYPIEGEASTAIIQNFKKAKENWRAGAPASAGPSAPPPAAGS